MNMQKKTIDEILGETLKVLKEGGVILYPTDTVWGLGCDATNPQAVAKIYEIKHRSDSKSLVLLANSLDQIALYIKEIPAMAIDLVEVNDRPSEDLSSSGRRRKMERRPVPPGTQHRGG